MNGKNQSINQCLKAVIKGEPLYVGSINTRVESYIGDVRRREYVVQRFEYGLSRLDFRFLLGEFSLGSHKKYNQSLPTQ